MAQFLAYCSSLSLAQLRGKNLAISLSAAVCFLLTLVILVLLVLYRSYKTLLQRLFLYLTIIILVHQAFISLDIQLQFDWEYGSVSCKVQGFMRSWTATATYFIIVAVTAHLMHLVCRQLLWSKSHTKFSLWTSNKIGADAIIVLFCLLLPLVYLWIPFYHGTYGIYSTSCWIQKVNRTCHKSVGSLDQITCTSIMRATMVSVIAAILVLFCILCKSSVHHSKINNSRMRTKLKQTLLLMSFFLVSFVVEGLGLGVYVFSAVSGKEVTSFVFWVAYDVAMPFSQLIIPIGLLVYLHSFKKETLKRAIKEWMHCCTTKYLTRKSHHENQANTKDIGRKDQETCAHIQSPPSSTYFDIEYTGAFTSVTGQCMPKRNYGSFGVKEITSANSENNWDKLSSCSLENTLKLTLASDLDNEKLSERNTGSCGVKLTKESKDPKSSMQSHQQQTEIRSAAIQDSPATQNCKTCCDVSKRCTSKDIELTESLTMVEPNRCVSPPSTTYFSIEYTGEFTSIVDHH